MRIFLFVMLIAISQAGRSQATGNFTFSDITADDLSRKVYSIDSTAAAVMLGESGSTGVAGNNDGGFSLQFKVRRRIHILKKSAYDYATVSVDLYTNGESTEKLDDLKAVTYNLEGGKVVESKLNVRSGVFSEKVNKNIIRKKFALPNVREGSIIEYEYTHTSDFLFKLPAWYFQGEIPGLWSEYKASLPQFLDYVMLQQGSLPYAIESNTEKQGSYMLQITKEVYKGQMERERYDLTCMVANFRWVMKDIPAFHEEAFTSSPQNHISKLQFQLSGMKEPLPVKSILASWPEFTSDFLKETDFINEVEKSGDWWPAEMKEVLKGTSSETDIAKAIYNYVWKRFTCTGDNYSGKRNPLKKIAEARTGNNIEINLLLAVMLRQAGLQADPVMLSTRSHGYSIESYPIYGQLNYLVCRVAADGDDWLLDASRPFLGFGKLSPECYNGQARVMNKNANLLHLNSSQLTETEHTMVTITRAGDGAAGWTGSITHRNGYYASGQIREKEKKEGAGAIQNELAAAFGEDIKIDSFRLDKLDQVEEPVLMNYQLKFLKAGQDIVYMNPVLISQFRQNPFKSAVRTYPVELPYKISQLYTFSMEIPEGYKLDEFPASALIRLNEKEEALFDYKSELKNGTLSVSCNLEVQRTNFSPEEYTGLRDFFAKIAAKLDEQIVLKKK
jgi:hypothetical protein